MAFDAGDLVYACILVPKAPAMMFFSGVMPDGVQLAIKQQRFDPMRYANPYDEPWFEPQVDRSLVRIALEGRVREVWSKDLRARTREEIERVIDGVQRP